MSSRNRNYLGAAKGNVPAVDLLKRWSDRRWVENLGSGAKRKGAEPRPRPEQPLYRVGHLQDDFFAFARTFAQRALCAAAMRSLAAADRRCFAWFPNLDDRPECPVILLRAAITSSSCRSLPSARLRSCFNCSSTAPSSVIHQLPILGIQSLLSRIPDLLAYVVKPTRQNPYECSQLGRRSLSTSAAGQLLYRKHCRRFRVISSRDRSHRRW
jgi:hypothetical protein